MCDSADISPRSIVLVDLDGTLVEGNTWRFFAALMLRRALRSVRPWRAITPGAMMILRKLHLISHIRLKRFFMLRSRRILSDSDLERFAADMAKRFNPKVMEIITAKRKSGSLIVLATAAAGEYAPLIGRLAGINDTLCTPQAAKRTPYIECRGERKADAAERFAEARKLPVTLVITDHPDDFPLFNRFPAARHIFIK